MMTFKLFSKYTTIFLFTVLFPLVGWGAVIHPFNVVNPNGTRNIQGNYAIAGNTVECITEKKHGYGGTCHGQTDYDLITSNMHVSKYIDIDGNSSTWNSTSSYITLPTSFATPSDGGKGVLWAGLFWQGRITDRTKEKMHFGIENGNSFDLIETGEGANYDLPSDFNSTGVNKIKLKIDTGTYNDVSAATLYTTGDKNHELSYAAYADVTTVVKTAINTSGKHVFTVANLTTNEGREHSPGVFGGWSLVVIYAENASGKMRNITVFNGYDKISNPSDPFTISGFVLPKSHTVHATLSLFSGEGEYRYGYRPGHENAYDWVKISDDGTNYSYMPGAAHDKNIFDAVFTGVTRDDITGYSNNLQVNNDGIDVDNFDVSSLMTTYRDKNPDLNKMYIQWSSNNDYITPSMLVFATQLYAPKMCYDYALRQDNRFLHIDRSSDPIARIDTLVSPSDISVTLYLRNEESDIAAQNISIRTDLNTTKFDQTGHVYSSNVNGSVLRDRGVPTYSNPLCDYNTSMDNSTSNNGCTDGHNIRKGLGTLSAQDYVYTKFLLSPKVSGITDINETLGLSLDYTIHVNGSTIKYNNYQLGGEHVPLCPPSSSYQPTWGQFNVIQSGSSTNNINTQISRKKFDANVIFDSDPTTGINDAPTSDIDTTVLVEIIDIGGFGDINASCANPSASLSEPIVVPISYTSNNWQATIPTQLDSYYNFAVQNAAFRVWYFTDNNGSLIQNWTAQTTDSGKTVTSISGLYDPATHTECASDCKDPTSSTCFECIKENYAHPLCSRDNFSVRPESYDMHIMDNNQSSSPTTLNDLSSIYNYSPNASTAPTQKIQVAADYNYRFDVNATGNDGLAVVPGYTENFRNESDHNATLLWNSTKNLTVCNNISDIPLYFYMKNGTITNSIITNPDVGDYKLHIIDTSWTKVDWGATETSHHTTADGFSTGTDCILNSDATTLNNNKYGCFISSSHGSDTHGNFYRDQNITFNPYSYAVSNTVTLRKGNGGAGVIPALTKPFVYMSNLSQDENMSVHLNTTVTARGKNSATGLSNYVTGCFAKPIHLTIAKTATTNPALAYDYWVHNRDSNGTILSANDINKTIAAGHTAENPAFTTTSSFFQKDQNGTIHLLTNLNYKRDVNVTANPEDINFTAISADDNATLINADLVTNKYAEGNVTVNQRVLYYYGRTIAPKIRVVCTNQTCRTGNGPNNNNSNHIPELITYVIFCDNATTICSNNALNGNLPTGATQVGDIRWYENRNHDKIDNSGNWLPDGTDGTIGAISEVNPSKPGAIHEISRAIKNQKYTTEVVIQHNSTLPLPYDAIMQMKSSPWLIYNETDNNATANQFIIEFVGNGGWSGKYEDKTTTKTNYLPVTNRRIMW